MQGALRERGERAHGLDLVTEELDAERLAARRGEHVDDAAADGEMSALLDLVDALVAGARELLGARVDARLGAETDLDSLRPGSRRGRALGERERRREDEPAGGEDVERPRPLPHEVRRRLEPGFPADAAAREQPDPLRPEVPGRRLGGVAGVSIVGQDADEPAVELQVKRRCDERQGRLRDPRAATGQVRGEAAEPFVLGELARKRREDRRVSQRLLVHDDGPARPGRDMVVRRRCRGARRRRARAARRR